MIVELELERRGHGQSSSSMLRSPFEGSPKKDGKTRGQEEGSGTFRYANGDFYVGEWYAGKREGHGTYQDSDGNVYEGEWKADEMEGRGTIRSRSADGAVIYEGEWKAGQPCALLMPGRTPKAHRLPTMDEKNKSRAEKIQAALFKLYPFVTFETVEPSKDEGSETQSYVDQGSELRPQQLWLEEVSNKEVSGMVSGMASSMFGDPTGRKQDFRRDKAIFLPVPTFPATQGEALDIMRRFEIPSRRTSPWS